MSTILSRLVSLTSFLAFFRITLHEALFSIKTFVGAMLALYIAYSIGLPHPFWAMSTAYIVSQVWTGAVRSKAVYRLIGTFLGSFVTLYIVPKFVNAPVLMIAVMSLWIGCCLYISVLDRTARSYLFMLAGYTAAMIGFPSVADPSNVFDTAVARVEEISLGILAATLVHSLVFPKNIGTTLLSQLDQMLADARLWIVHSVQHSDIPSDALQQSAKDLRQLAHDLTQLRLQATHLPFDTSHIRWTASAIEQLQNEITTSIPIVSAIEDRLSALREVRLESSLQHVLKEFLEWMDSGSSLPPIPVALDNALTANTQYFQQEKNPTATWEGTLQLSLSQHLVELVQHIQICVDLRRMIQLGLQGKAFHYSFRKTTTFKTLHQDHGLALLSALAVMVAVSVCCAFWIATGWNQGATAVLQAAVFSSFFASQDNPVPNIKVFLQYTIYSIPLSAIYLLIIMPSIHSFEMLLLTVFPVAFILGIGIARPALSGRSIALFLGFSGTLALHDTQSADFVSFTNTMIAQIIGIGIAAVTAAIFRKISVERSVQRILAANWKDLAKLADINYKTADREIYLSRVLDRVGLLHSRLPLIQTPMAGISVDSLSDVRLGYDLAELQRLQILFPDMGLKRLLKELSIALKQKARGRFHDSSESILFSIDKTLFSLIKNNVTGNISAFNKFSVAENVSEKDNFSEYGKLSEKDNISEHGKVSEKDNISEDGKVSESEKLSAAEKRSATGNISEPDNLFNKNKNKKSEKYSKVKNLSVEEIIANNQSILLSALVGIRRNLFPENTITNDVFSSLIKPQIKPQESQP